jgi:hypothetical protein
VTSSLGLAPPQPRSRTLATLAIDPFLIAGGTILAAAVAVAAAGTSLAPAALVAALAAGWSSAWSP